MLGNLSHHLQIIIFFQLRYKNKSIDLTALLDDKGNFDEKGVFIENLIEPQFSTKMRFEEFLKNYNLDLINLKPDKGFSTSFEKEIRN